MVVEGAYESPQNVVTESLKSFLVRGHITYYDSSLLEELTLSCVTPLGEALEFCAWFPPDLVPMCPFPLSFVAVIVISLSYEYNCMLSHVSSFNKSLNLWMILETLDTGTRMESDCVSS